MNLESHLKSNMRNLSSNINIKKKKALFAFFFILIAIFLDEYY